MGGILLFILNITIKCFTCFWQWVYNTRRRVGVTWRSPWLLQTVIYCNPWAKPAVKISCSQCVSAITLQSHYGRLEQFKLKGMRTVLSCREDLLTCVNIVCKEKYRTKTIFASTCNGNVEKYNSLLRVCRLV